jgi:hypothetical protein
VTAHAPVVEFARKGANPTLKTIELVRGALRGAGEPLSRNAMLGLLSEWGHGTSRQSLSAALGLLMLDGLVVEGSKGLQWVPEADGVIRETILRKRRR